MKEIVFGGVLRMNSWKSVLTLILFYILFNQCACDCTLPAGNFRCYNEYGDPVSGNPVPSWGACESLDCSTNQYPDPIYVRCDGDTNTWTSDPCRFKCLESTGTFISSFTIAPDNSTHIKVTSVSLKKSCQFKELPDRWNVPYIGHSMNYDRNTNQLYVCGGKIQMSKQCLKLNLNKPTAEWENVQYLFDKPRYQHGSSLDSDTGMLYLTGGYPVSGGSQALGNIQALSLVEETWTTLAELNGNVNRIYRHCSVILNNKLYIIGGLGYSMKDIYELDLKNPDAVWVEKLGKLSTPRENLACLAAGDNIYISGGNDHISGGYQVWDSVERYSTKYDVVVYLPPMKKARRNHVMVLLDGRPTVVGGSSADFNDPMLEIEQFSEIKDRWEIVSIVKFPEKMVEAKGAGITEISKILCTA